MLKKMHLCFVIVLVFFCVSCSNAPDSSTNKEVKSNISDSSTNKEVKSNIELAEDTIKNASKCFANSKFEEASKYIELKKFKEHIECDIATETISADELIELWLPTVRFEIISSEEINDKCVESKIKVAALSCKSVLTMQQSLLDVKIEENKRALSSKSESQIREWLSRAIEETYRSAYFDFDHPLVYTEVICTVNEVDDKWKMAMNAELINAMLGDEIGAMEEVLGVTVMMPKE